MEVADRLHRYYDFDDAVAEAVADAAERQNRYSFQELADQFGIADGSRAVVPEGHSKPLEVLTFNPPEGIDYDPASARVLHTAYAYPVNKNTAMHAMRLFETCPDKPLIVVGNAAFLGMKTGKLSLRDMYAMNRGNTLLPAAKPTLAYLRDQGKIRNDHFGFSYGADKAATVIGHSGDYGQVVGRGVLVEPVSVVMRSMYRLAKDLGHSGERQQEYVRQVGSKPYDEVWAENSLLKFAAWLGGVVRPSNLAIASVLAHDGFSYRAFEVLTKQPHAKLAVAWGDMSELVPDEAIDAVVTELQERFGPARVRAMRLRGMQHAAADDIDLHAAIMLQGLLD